MMKILLFYCAIIIIANNAFGLKCKAGENNIVGFHVQTCKESEMYCYDVQCKNNLINTRMKGCTRERHFCDYARFGCKNTLTDVEKNNCIICSTDECNSKS